VVLVGRSADRLGSPLADALEHLRGTATGERAAAFENLSRRLEQGHVTARRDALRELLAVAIDEAGDRVAHASTGLLRADATAVELRAALQELGALLDLLEAVLP
jgi:hypothetical protein